MPRKHKRPCKYHECPKLVEGRYCEKHQKLINKNYEKYQRKYKPSVRYVKAWRKIRNKYIKQHPLCEICLKEERLKTAEHVHHTVPLSDGGTNDEKNLMSLCKSCHSKIHADDGSRRGRKKN